MHRLGVTLRTFVADSSPYTSATGTLLLGNTSLVISQWSRQPRNNSLCTTATGPYLASRSSHQTNQMLALVSAYAQMATNYPTSLTFLMQFNVSAILLRALTLTRARQDSSFGNAYYLRSPMCCTGHPFPLNSVPRSTPQFDLTYFLDSASIDTSPPRCSTDLSTTAGWPSWK